MGICSINICHLISTPCCISCSGCTRHGAPMDKWVQWQTLPAMFYINVARNKGWGVHPNLNLWALILSKNEKTKKWIFLGSEGNKGGEGWEMHCHAFLCLWSKSFIDTSIFHFKIKIGFVIPKEEFGVDKFHGGIKKYLLNMNLEDFVDLQVFVPGGREDTWLNLKTCCRQPSDSAPGILGHVSIPRTCLGQDIAN